MKLLLVEDDAMVARGVMMCLQQADFEVTWAGSAEQALHEIDEAGFAVSVIDLGLPVTDGIALIGQLRARRIAWPILILTARDALDERVRGLDAGADDYMIKPFEAPELLARLRALLRRSQADTSAVFSFAGLSMDLAHRKVQVRQGCGGVQELQLSPKEWMVLEYMLKQLPKAVSKERLLEQLIGESSDLTPNAVEVYVSRLRAKIACAGVGITHVRGYGYRIEEIVDSHHAV